LASIFVSHSRYDKWFIDPLAQNLRAMKIQPILIELETPQPYPLPKIITDRIAKADAFFLLWTSKVAYNQTTRDNVIWEVSDAHTRNKPILVVAERNVALPMMIPYITTYLEFDVSNQGQIEFAFNQVLSRAKEIAQQNAAGALFWLLLGVVSILGIASLTSEEKQCPKCGNMVPKDSVFCPKCGYRFRRRR